jgi:hypothetical protein
VTLALSLVCAAEAAGSGWKVRPTPNPIGATHSQLVGVSCPSRAFCLAVGYASSRDGAYTTLSERWDGTSWSIERGAKPAGAQVSVLSAVSCAARRSCMAVGYFINRVGVALPLAERWNGLRWTVQRPPQPGGAANGNLVGVSCASRRFCTAVGSFSDSRGSEVGLAERWDGVRWSIEPTETPVGAAATRLKGVSCISPMACTAVGTFVDSNGDFATLAERWNGTDWTLQSTPTPSPSYSQLVGVWCASLRFCEAVGFYARAAGPSVTLAEQWDGSSWVSEPTPDRRSARSTQLFSVSCRSSTACTAVGNFANGAGAFETIAERRERGRWAIQRAAHLSGASNSGLDAVACPSASSCTAVGYFIDRSGAVVTLAEQYA